MLDRRLEMNRIFYCKQSLLGLCNVDVTSIISTTECFSIRALAPSVQHYESKDSKRKENAEIQEEVW
jgi:hypothetical protein